MSRAVAAALTSSVQAEPTYKVQEVADHLRVEKSVVYRLVREGALRHVRVGRLVRVPKSAVDEFLRGGAL